MGKGQRENPFERRPAASNLDSGSDYLNCFKLPDTWWQRAVHLKMPTFSSSCSTNAPCGKVGGAIVASGDMLQLELPQETVALVMAQGSTELKPSGSLRTLVSCPQLTGIWTSQ